MDLYKIQQNILRKAKIDPQKVNAWIYDNQSIVFDFLLNDYFVSISYSTLGQTFNFIDKSLPTDLSTPQIPNQTLKHTFVVCTVFETV